MERSITALCMITFVVSPLAASENIAVDIGPGVHNNRGSDALFLRYTDDFRQSWFIGQNFYEWSLGVWNGKARNDGVGFSLGSRGLWDRYYLNGSVGVAYLEHKTELSGTHQQFSARIGGGIIYERTDVGLYFTHYSNAKAVFGWNGPNAGYDFITLQISRALK